MNDGINEFGVVTLTVVTSERTQTVRVAKASDVTVTFTDGRFHFEGQAHPTPDDPNTVGSFESTVLGEEDFQWPTP